MAPTRPILSICSEVLVAQLGIVLFTNRPFMKDYMHDNEHDSDLCMHHAGSSTVVHAKSDGRIRSTTTIKQASTMKGMPLLWLSSDLLLSCSADLAS